MQQSQSSSGLEHAFLEHRERLARFLAARGAGEAAEDLLQEMWLKISASKSGPVASPLSYLYRMADMLMIDRYRSMRQSRAREKAWTDVTSGPSPGVSDAPSAERQLIARDYIRQVSTLLAALEPPRLAEVFRRHRIDGLSQREVAQELGISLSTVESDLRAVYRALADLRERHDEV